MENIVIILLSLIVFLISLLLMKFAAGDVSISKLNMLSFTFYVFFILHSYIGSILILMFPDERFNMMISAIRNRDVFIYGWLGVSYAMIMFPCGIILAKTIAGKFVRLKSYRNYIFQPLTHSYSYSDSYTKCFLYPTYLLCILVAIYVVLNVGISTIVSAFSIEDQVALLVLRKDLSENFTGNLYVKNIVGMILTPIMCYISYLYYKLTKGKVDFAFFVVLFLCTFILLTYKFEKSPFVMFLLGFLFLKIYLGGRVNLRLIFALGTCLFIGLIGIYLFITKNSDPSYLLSPFKEGLVGRVLISGISSLYSHLEVFPTYVDHIGFNSLSNLVSNTIGENLHSRSGRVVLEIYAPGWVENGYGGVFNTLFIGEAWANFGLLGLLFSPIWVGFLHGLIFHFIISVRKTPIALGVFVYLSYKTSIMGGINDYIYNIRLSLALLIVLIITISAKFLHELYRTKSN
jgi:hypothetical protein